VSRRKIVLDTPASTSRFIHTGCTLLNLILGGGWPLGRISNVVGDKSTGKTLLAIEASANFALQFPEGKIYYHEAEAAFDKDYAATLGMPIEAVTFIEDVKGDTSKASTVEGLIENIQNIVAEHSENENVGLYIVDSLDALSDKSEMERDADKGSYGAEKAKKMSEFFRKVAKSVESSKIHLMIISQMRDKIGVMFGEKHSRSGGKALDYYASQILWLAEKAKIKKTISKVERVIGLEVVANCKKNKISMPFRTCLFPIIFGYGIEDDVASRLWLKSIGKEADTAMPKEEVRELVINLWKEIEEKFSPKESKY
jgi:recombination protein RecA